MAYDFAKKSLALTALVAMAACSGAPSGTSTMPAAEQQTQRVLHPASSGILTRIVGVGDSLTAGYQAGGFLGATGVKDPLDPGVLVRPGQENGWWADLDEQASGLPIPTAIARMYAPKVSPLPLIAAPGLNNQLVPTLPPVPFDFLKPGDACTDNHDFNEAGYLLGGLSRVRMNPKSTTIRDVAVPGITLHEANTLFEPQTNTCEPLPGIPGLLSQIIGGESSTFWPVLGNFANMGTNLTMVRAAASMHPTLATVWLGANDLLKFMGSGGRFFGGDTTAGQTQNDVGTTVQTLEIARAHVVVANLPDVLRTPYFMRVSVPKKFSLCNTQTYIYCLLRGLGFPGSTSEQLLSRLSTMYHLATPSGCKPATTTAPCGYMTLQGSLTSLKYFMSIGQFKKLPNLDCAPPDYTKNCVAGSGLGQYYITPAFAAQVQGLNNQINKGINAAAYANRVPLVDVQKIFEGIAKGNPSNPYYRLAISINPGVCCTLAAASAFPPTPAARGGLVSFDGLHPSNTGYALLAFAFIETINRAFKTSIPEIDVRKAYNGTRCSNATYCFADVYAPQVAGDAEFVRAGNGITIRYIR